MRIDPRLLWIVCGLCMPLHAQELQEFDGVVSIEGIRYHADYDYKIDGRDTIYHGAFLLSRIGPKYGDEPPFDFLTIRGSYTDGIPTEEWNMRVGSFEPTANGKYAEYGLRFKVKGEEINAKGKIRNGKKTGAWQLSDWAFEESAIVDTLIITTLLFEEDELTGELNIGSSDKRLRGKVGEEQEPMGKWVYSEEGEETGKYSKKEEWTFEEQRLVERKIFREGNVYALEYAYDAPEPDEWEWVKMDEDYFELIRLQTEVIESPYAGLFAEAEGFENFYERFLAKMQSLDTAMVEGFVFIGFSSPVQVTVPVYAYSRNENRSIKRIGKAYEELAELIEVTTGDPQVRLASISSAEVLRIKGALIKIEEELLLPIKSLIELHDSEVLKHLRRDKYVASHFDFDTELQVRLENVQNDEEGEEEKDEWEFEFEIDNVEVDKEKEALEQVQDWTAGLLTAAKSMTKKVEDYIKEMEKEEQLVAKESEFIKRYNELELAVDSVLNDGHNEIAGFNIKKPLQSFLTTQLNTYSAIEDSEGRKEKLQGMMDCFDRFEELLKTLEDSRDNYFAHRDEYSRQVFNAYTFTYMEEIAKPSIVKAVRQKLLPALYENLHELNCDNMDAINENFDRLFTALRDMRRKETRKEERKVRRMDDPAEISELLEFKLTFF